LVAGLVKRVLPPHGCIITYLLEQAFWLPQVIGPD
jgi:hypothetical protein